MDNQKSDDSVKSKSSDSNRFISVTRHLKNKDFKLLKDDLGMFNIPESWDLQFENDNRR